MTKNMNGGAALETQLVLIGRLTAVAALLEVNQICLVKPVIKPAVKPGMTAKWCRMGLLKSAVRQSSSTTNQHSQAFLTISTCSVWTTRLHAAGILGQGDDEWGTAWTAAALEPPERFVLSVLQVLFVSSLRSRQKTNISNKNHTVDCWKLCCPVVLIVAIYVNQLDDHLLSIVCNHTYSPFAPSNSIVGTTNHLLGVATILLVVSLVISMIFNWYNPRLLQDPGFCPAIPASRICQAAVPDHAHPHTGCPVWSTTQRE